MKKRFIAMLLAATMSIGLLAGCGSSSSSTDTAEDTTEEAADDTEESTEAEETDEAEAETEESVTLRSLSWNSMVGHLNPGLASVAGYYDEEGVDVEITYNNSNPDNIQALLQDKADFIAVGATAVLNYIDEGSDIVIIGGAMSLGETLYALPERADEFSELTEETLSGKTIGVTRLNTGDVAFRKILSDKGIDLSVVEFVELDSQATVVEAVLKGEVDLGIAFLTYRATAEAQGLVAISQLDAEDEWPDYICCRVVTTRDKLEAYRDEFVAVMKAQIRAYALYKTDEDATLEYAQQFLEIEEETLIDQLYSYGHLGLSPNPDLTNTSEFFQAMVDVGYSEGNVDITDYIDVTIFQDALAELLEEDPDNEVYLELQEEDLATNYL